MRISGAALALTATAAVLGAGAAAVPLVEARLPDPPRVALGDWVPPRGEPVSAWLERRAELEGTREVTLRHPGGVLVATRSELGLELDKEDALRALSAPRAPFGVWTRLRVALGGVPPEPVEIPARYRFDPEQASSWLVAAAPALREEAVDARLDLRSHERVEARPGRELDLGASLSRLAALEGGQDLELAFTALAPAVPTSALADVDPSMVLSQYETDFARRGGPRVLNIARAARLLDGALMAPGEVWSFNRSVGPRTLERGFVDAPVIVADEMEPGVGGGVCQVATTLFAASVLGGLDVVRRRSHSRPSGYAPLGLDATVIDGEVDLQLRNPYPVPVMVHAYLPVKTRLRVELLGAPAPGKIEHSYSVRKSEDFYRRVAVRTELAPDQVKRQQKGSPGYDVLSTVRTRYPDGSVRVRHYSSTYYPVPEVYWVGSDVDPEALPPLPERATHTELQQEPQAEAAPATTPASFTR